MIIDLHSHTGVGSSDSVADPHEVIEQAKREGLDAVCITEHGVKKPEGLDRLSEEHGFLVLGGFEVSTELGDILIFGLDSVPRSLHRAVDLRRYVVEAGGVMVAAHPFRWDLSHKPWLKAIEAGITIERACERLIFQLVDAMEIANGWATELDVEFCRAVSQRLGMGGTGGSDAHLPEEIGYCVTIFEDSIRNEEDLVRAIKNGKYQGEDRRPEHLKTPVRYFLSR